jgi:translocation and assembly module TamA
MFKQSLAWISFIIIFAFSPICGAQKIIEITGVNDDIKTNINTFLGSKRLECNADESSITTFIESIPEKVHQAIRPFGYYNSKLDMMIPANNKECWSVVIDIQPGPQTILTNPIFQLSGDGSGTKPFKSIESSFLKTIGTYLNHNKYENFKSKLTETASLLGYLDAKFISNSINVYPESNSAQIMLHFDTGVRYKVATIQIQQQPQFLNPDFIRKLIPLKEEDYFTTKKLFEIKKKLSSTAYFETASIELDFKNKFDGKVPINIYLTPGDRINYSTGIGFSTDTGARVSFDYNHFRLTDFGYQLQSKVSLSEVVSEFSTRFKLPSKSLPANKWYSLETGYRRERSENISSNATKIAISETRVKENQWQNINYLDLIKVQDVADAFEKDSLLLVPGTSWSYIDADNPSRPSRGFKVQADLKAASNSIISDVTFLQLTLGYKGIRSFGTDRLLYRGQVGTTLTHNIEELPSNYRFFAGGDNSIRGFNYHTLAPANSDGEIIGGKNLVSASVEYEHHLANQWAIAIFSDIGNAFNDQLKLEKSIGAGVRWFSPIGPIRLDLGVPLDNKENSFQIHITVGPDL